MNLNTNALGELADFSWGGLIQSAGAALKDGGPALIRAGVQNRMEKINAKRAERLARLQAAGVAFEPVTLQPAPAAVAVTAMPPNSRRPSWLLPAAVAAGVLAVVVLRK